MKCDKELARGVIMNGSDIVSSSNMDLLESRRPGDQDESVFDFWALLPMVSIIVFVFTWALIQHGRFFYQNRCDDSVRRKYRNYATNMFNAIENEDTGKFIISLNALIVDIMKYKSFKALNNNDAIKMGILDAIEDFDDCNNSMLQSSEEWCKNYFLDNVLNDALFMLIALCIYKSAKPEELCRIIRDQVKKGYAEGCMDFLTYEGTAKFITKRTSSDPVNAYLDYKKEDFAERIVGKQDKVVFAEMFLPILLHCNKGYYVESCFDSLEQNALFFFFLFDSSGQDRLSSYYQYMLDIVSCCCKRKSYPSEKELSVEFFNNKTRPNIRGDDQIFATCIDYFGSFYVGSDEIISNSELREEFFGKIKVCPSSKLMETFIDHLSNDLSMKS